MSTCYLCTIHGSPSENPESIMHCSTCGIFTCIWDGARVHGKGACECAICMVRVLVASANRSLPPTGPGGGGAAVEAEVREYLATDDFERDCEHLAFVSKAYRDGWRPLLAMQQLPTQTAHEFGRRLEQLTGGRRGLADQVAAGLLDRTMDGDLLADAAGVGEYSRRLENAGPRTLASVAKAVADEEAADRAARELQEKIQAEAAAAAQPSYVTQTEPAKQEELKVRYMGQ